MQLGSWLKCTETLYELEENPYVQFGFLKPEGRLVLNNGGQAQEDAL